MSLPFDKDLRGIKVYLRPNATDFRKGIAKTVSLIVGRMQIPMDEKSLFIFCSTNRKQIRILYKEKAGIWMCQKVIRYGTYNWPRTIREAEEISYEGLVALISDPIPIELLEIEDVAKDIEFHINR